MKKIFKLIYSNKFFAFIMLLIQIAILAVGYVWLDGYGNYFMSASLILRLSLIIHEINRDDEPSFKLTWVIIIAIIPVFGALFYLYTRAGFITKSMQQAYKNTKVRIDPFLKQSDEILSEIEEKHESNAGFVKYLTNYGGAPVYKNTAVRYYPLGDYMFEDMKKELQKAKDFIFLEFFIINNQGRMWKEILSILKQKVKEGVEVRVLYDGMGCMTTLPRGYAEELKKWGIKCAVFSPIQLLLSTYQNNRDHRKIMVIDGRCAFTGGINLADEYINEHERFGHWKDNGVMLTGNAAAGFTGMFLEMWNIAADEKTENYKKYISASEVFLADASGYTVPFCDSPLDNIYVGKQAYIENLNSAKDYVYIMTPYLVVDNALYEAMKYASERGVDVKIIMPHTPDKPYAFWLARTYYPMLLRAGVKIYEYIPGFVHAKMSISDGKRAIVGTINHDYRSLYLHYECAAYMLDVPAILDMEQDFMETLASCMEITMEEYKKMNIFKRLFGRALKIIAPLL